jgi:tRNA A58 N-methylase Trm61
MAWALSKTGGKLVTVELDARQYEKALKNFEKAWLIAPKGFLEHVESLGLFETTIEGSSAGVSVSYLRSAPQP